MKIQIAAALIAGLLLGRVAIAESIGLHEFLDIIKQTHPLIQQETLSPEIERKSGERFLASQSWLLTASPSFYHSKSARTSDFFPTRIDDFGFEASVERPFWSTGGRLSLNWFSNLTDQSLPDTPYQIGPPRLFEHRLGASYSQPLLRNYRGKLDRLDYELTEYTVDASELESMENQEAFLLDIGSRYIDWVLLVERRKIAGERLLLAEEELAHISEKRKANLVDPVDVLRSEDAVRTARQNVVLIESKLKAKRAELATLAQRSEITRMYPDFDLYELEELPPAEEALVKLKERSRILRALELQRERLMHLRGGFAETKRPSLDLDLGIGIKGGDDELSRSLEVTKPDFLVALMFTHQLGSRTARTDVAKTDLQMKQLESQTQRVWLDLNAAVVSLLIQIKELENVMELNQQEIISAREKTSEEQKLYNQGRGELTFVIQSRDNVQNAKLLYAENAADYHRLVLQYEALTDQLLE